MSIIDPTVAVKEFQCLTDLRFILENEGCKACSLGFQEGLNGCCVARGNPSVRRMIVGEAPGKHEDARSLPFVGPAGQLWDKVMASVNWSDNDWYITNIVLCRPIAPRGSGKENFTPKVEQIKKCRPYLDAQIKIMNPKIIITLGKPATEAILGVKGIRMGDYRGKLHSLNDVHLNFYDTLEKPIYAFPMLHPSYLLHSQKNHQQYQKAREDMWADIQRLKQIVDSRSL